MWEEEASFSLLFDPYWTAGSYSVQFNYFTENFVPCSISFVVLLVSINMLVGIDFFSPRTLLDPFVAFGFQRS